jgi:hypothetical protein
MPKGNFQVLQQRQSAGLASQGHVVLDGIKAQVLVEVSNLYLAQNRRL